MSPWIASDLQQKSGLRVTRPSEAWESNCLGDLPPGDFFDNRLPTLFAGPVPCPLQSCVCLNKYSFLGEVNRNVSTNPLKIYSEILRKKRIP